MNFEKTLKTVASSGVGLTLVEAILLTDTLVAASRRPAVKKYDFTTHEGRVAWVKDDAECMAFLNNDRKIQAIKRVRDVIQCSLVQAKDACDAQSPSFVLPNRNY